MERIVRIKEENIGQMTYYSPQIQKNFWGIKYWTTICTLINSGSFYSGIENRYRDKQSVREELENYSKLTNEKIKYDK